MVNEPCINQVLNLKLLFYTRKCNEQCLYPGFSPKSLRISIHLSWWLLLLLLAFEWTDIFADVYLWYWYVINLNQTWLDRICWYDISFFFLCCFAPSDATRWTHWPHKYKLQKNHQAFWCRIPWAVIRPLLVFWPMAIYKYLLHPTVPEKNANIFIWSNLTFGPARCNDQFQFSLSTNMR